jgi:hypothetical protein
MDRFKLEELLGQLGSLEDDISVVLGRLYDDPKEADADEIANALIGIKTLHKLRLEEVFRTIEHLITKGDLK